MTVAALSIDGKEHLESLQKMSRFEKGEQKKIACQTGKEQIRESIFEELAIPWHIQNPTAKKAKGLESWAGC